MSETSKTKPPGIPGDGMGDKVNTLYHVVPVALPTHRTIERGDRARSDGTNPGNHEVFFRSDGGVAEFYWVFRKNTTPKRIRETCRQLKDLLRAAGWWEDKQPEGEKK